ncbi:MAG: hypothetical protein ACR2K2_03000 [Mycobacteriales bacterium]
MEPTGSAGTAAQHADPVVPSRGDGVGASGTASNGQLTALRTELEALRAEVAATLQVGLEHVTTRTGARLDEAAGTLGGRVTARLEAAAADLRRTLNAALETQVNSAAVTQAAAIDTRSALESRAVILEDALAALSERVETLRREGTEGARHQLRVLGADLTILRQCLDPVEDRRLRAEAQSRLEAALDNRDERLLEAVSDLLTAVTSERVATQTRLLQLEDTMTRVLDSVLSLEDGQATRAADSPAQAADLLAGVQSRVDAVRGEVGSQLGRMREELTSEVAMVAVHAAAAVEAGERDRAALLERMGEHRSDLTARLDGLADQIATLRTAPEKALHAVSEELSRAADALHDARAAPAEAQDEVRTAAEVSAVDLRTELAQLTAAVEKLTAGQPASPKRVRSGRGETAPAKAAGKQPAARAGAATAATPRSPSRAASETEASPTAEPASRPRAARATSRAADPTTPTPRAPSGTAGAATPRSRLATAAKPARTQPTAAASTPTPTPTRTRVAAEGATSSPGSRTAISPVRPVTPVRRPGQAARRDATEPATRAEAARSAPVEPEPAQVEPLRRLFSRRRS